MKKIFLLLILACAFTALSKAYNNQETLHAYYYQDYNEMWVYNMNASSVYYQLHAEGSTSVTPVAYTFAAIKLYTSLNWTHTKAHWVYNGATTYSKTLYAPSGQTIVKAKLSASGEGRWNNNMKYTYNSWVEINW